ncbi:MAG: Gfo/Idh/MocA family oxidoreductase [Clostridiales bacterium]|nr:Gfo/Idh/MocA family oxidoreductase [Clostridiales bacterium]
MSRKVRVAVVGLHFGESFPIIYREHPDVEYVGICDKDEELLNRYGDKFGFERRYTNLDDILSGDEYDAVHIVTPIHTHAKLSVDVLNSGKHCACTVPAATTVDELKSIVAAQKKSKKNYMMMETAVYTYQFLYVKDLVEKGEMGNIQFLKGAHYQDMENWPHYWMGLPPMHYATHAISPLLAISNTRAVKVHCFGSGIMREELHKQYGNPYPVETAIFQLEKDNLCAEVTRSLFQTARAYIESFNVYGEKKSFEWHMENELPVVFEMGPLNEGRGRDVTYSRVIPPDRQDLLPKEIAYHTASTVVTDKNNVNLYIIQGGGHHGSHPHLVHEFVRSIVEDRRPWIDAVTAANWTAAGICAHESAMHGGDEVIIPSFE